MKKIDQAFAQADEIVHPFLTKEFRSLVKSMGDIMPSIKSRSAVTIDNVVYDSRLTDLPIEERKRREAQAKGKPYRVPEWWRGERANYQVAKQMMVTLPKKGGKPVKDI